MQIHYKPGIAQEETKNQQNLWDWSKFTYDYDDVGYLWDFDNKNLREFDDMTRIFDILTMETF